MNVVDTLFVSNRGSSRQHIENIYRWGNFSICHGENLYRALWQPLEGHLAGIENIYYSPISVLHSVSFQAIRCNDTTVLADRYSLHLVSSTAQIAAVKSTDRLTVSSAALFGGIRYDSHCHTIGQISEIDNLACDEQGTWAIDSTQIDRDGWGYLPATKNEVCKINDIFNNHSLNTTLYTDSLASEESFKSLSEKKIDIIHVATHGFFLPTRQDALNTPFIQNLHRADQALFGPLLCSGLLMAGANRVWLGGRSVDGNDDGVLTAQEVATLDLQYTNLVILSACQTARGEASLDGVFGLQRAFKIAGAQTIVMSLWKIPDIATSELMINFYNILLRTSNRRQAFRESIERVRAKYVSPYYWAGFVMLD